jgi:hypothetical protein
MIRLLRHRNVRAALFALVAFAFVAGQAIIGATHAPSSLSSSSSGAHAADILAHGHSRDFDAYESHGGGPSGPLAHDPADHEHQTQAIIMAARPAIWPRTASHDAARAPARDPSPVGMPLRPPRLG